jgi:hypothetical protein
MIRGLIILGAVAWLAAAVRAEVIVMASGRVVVAEIVERDPRSITIACGEGLATLPRTAVSSILDPAAFREVRTQRWPNVPSPARRDMMDGTWQPSPQEKFAAAALRLRRSGRDDRFLSSVPRTVRSKFGWPQATGIYRVSPPPPYVGPVYGYPYLWAYPCGYGRGDRPLDDPPENG